MRPAEELPGPEERRHGAAVLARERAGSGGPEQRDAEPRAERRERRRERRGARERR